MVVRSIFRYHYRITGISVLVFLSCFFIDHCSDKQNIPQTANSGYKIIPLPLAGDIAKRYAEISGLAWYRDQLILLPQYPDRFSLNNVSSIFRIPKREIIDHIDRSGPSTNLTATRIDFYEQGIPEDLPGFQGYESIVFIENKIYFTIEANQDGAMQAFLVEGLITDNMERVVLNKSSLRLLPMPVQIRNFAYEGMINSEDRLFIFYEANGANINDTPQMIEVSLENGDIRLKPFLNLEYRITDATSLNKEGHFWAINYFWPGDFDVLNPASDKLAALSNPPISFSRDKAVERLVEMQYSQDGIKLSHNAPIVLRSAPNGESRNWEGIVRLENRGFILVTDKHPQTILAFLPFN